MSNLSIHGIPGSIGQRLTQHRHTALLCALVAAFMVRPVIGDSNFAAIIFNVAMLVILVSALHVLRSDELWGQEPALYAERRRNSFIGWTLATSAAGLRFATFVWPNPYLMLAAQLTWMSFFAFVAWAELRAVLRQKRITGEAISMSISVYLLLGAAWSFLYDVIYQLQPTAFTLNGAATALVAPGHPIFPVLAYFSYVTLTTIGYGDIAPVTLQARYAALAEGIAGQFYLAILVARLVSMQLAQMSPSTGLNASD